VWLLSNAYTENDYTPPNVAGTCTLDRIIARSLTIRVHNAPIYLSKRLPAIAGGRDEGDWDQEVLYIPGFYTTSRRELHGVRARSAVAGQPALITIEAFGPGEG
jgi:hypothetical protein